MLLNLWLCAVAGIDHCELVASRIEQLDFVFGFGRDPAWQHYGNACGCQSVPFDLHLFGCGPKNHARADDVG